MATIPLLRCGLGSDQEVVLARQRARQIAELLGYAGLDQTRIATAVSEIARNAFRYATGGKVEFLVDLDERLFLIRIQDQGPGIADLNAVLDGRYHSRTGMGLGIVGSRRLMDRFEISSPPAAGTTVMLGKALPNRSTVFAPQDASRIAQSLVQSAAVNPHEELLEQNQELLRALDALRQRQAEIERLSRELDETNRGVMALLAELEESNRNLQRASELKSRFLSNMSHEFRTPLNSVLSLSRMLLDRMDGDLSPEQEKQVLYIRRSADALFELVNDLLDLAKIEAGKITVHVTEFDPRELLGTLRGMFRPLVASNAVNLVFEEPRDVPRVNSDEQKVAQILRNFISNALKFTERGEVRVRVERQADGYLAFQISDTGIGIAPEDQDRVFEEFTQVENPLQRRVKGTGLGLPLSRKLAELLGGRVQVESAPGVGSTFTLVLPTSIRDDEADAPIVVEASEPENKLLIIDDDEISRYLVRGYLSDTDVRCVEACGGEEGLRKAREEHPRAILLDLIMPDLNGFEVLQALKSEPATRGIPVIVITSKILDERERAELTPNTVAVLSKETQSRQQAALGIRAALTRTGLCLNSAE